MKVLVILLITCCSFLDLEGQNFNLKSKSILDAKISETSGLICVGGKFFTHGDSGDEAVLYEFDTLTGNVIRVLPIKGARNIDWEELTCDDSFVYVGDFGNNAGMRKDLTIYKFQKKLLLIDTIREIDTIHFQYAIQTDYSNKTYQTNFDAEAMFATDSCLYIFSKNWGNFKSYIYSCPKEKGNYSLKILDSINSSGLITGACKSNVSSKVMLCGYTFNAPFILEIDSFFKSSFKNSIKRQEFTSMGNVQIEAIAEVSKNHYFLTSEKLSSDQTLFELNKVETSGVHKNKSHEIGLRIINSNSEKQFLWNSHNALIMIQILDMNGRFIREIKLEGDFFGKIDLNKIPEGVYVFRGITHGGVMISEKFVQLN